ncbi:MAG: potassium-transporting ATPase subunit KdpA [Acidobacteriia bacterium]|nr:potassium-transporting ATPase subunit KdpA [Terriglobia bacterium]
MDFYSALQYVAFIVTLTVCVKPLGRYLEKVFSGQKTALDRLCSPMERLLYRVAAVNPAVEMGAREYATCFVLFSLAGTFLLYAILRLQNFLPWFNPQYHTTPLTPDLAMNTAISFSTTTTWQAYGGENTMSYFSQMAGLCAQNFLAGAAGLAVGVAFIRGFARQRSETLGNFWVDLTRSLLWVLLPGALLGAVLLLWQGVPMNFHPYTEVASLEGTKQVIPQGPVAAFEIIKNLGTNGGGFFNANGAHPYENPTPLANFFEMLAIALLPASLTNTFGRMTRQPRQGWMLYCVMLALFVAGLTVTHWAEHRGNHAFAAVNQAAGNLEGKEVRFGVGGSALTATVTSNTATGSYNAMHDSFSPLGGMAPLVNMLLGEVAFGGLGTGMYSMLMVAVIAVFLTGLMMGRTPEYLGKKIGPAETKMVMLYALAAPLTILPLTALAVLCKPGLAGLTTNQGVHGFTEILYAYTSCFANNGQNFAALSANTVFYNLTTTVAMLLGRFALAAPALGLAGLVATQKSTPPSAGTLRTDSPLFALALTATILIVAGLCYFPALTLGPILEHLLFR